MQMPRSVSLRLKASATTFGDTKPGLASSRETHIVSRKLEVLKMEASVSGRNFYGKTVEKHREFVPWRRG